MSDIFTNNTSLPNIPDPTKPEGVQQLQEDLKNKSGLGWDDFWSNVSDWWQNSALNPGNWQKKIQESLGISNIKDTINNATQQGKIAYTESGIPYDDSNIDSQINAKMQELAYKRDDEAYDRLIAALKRNGINPVLALSNSASAFSSDSGFRSNYNMTDKDQVNSALKVGMIIALLMKVLK